MRRLLIVAVVAAAVVAASAAHATNECRGLPVCVPVVGPWILTSSASRVEYDLTCPARFIVAGLDAELSTRGIDVGFVGTLGTPVNPGITTKRDAVFLGRVVRGRPAVASFRPHIGCVPASGGGQRVPTAYHAFPPGQPADRRIVEVTVRGVRTVRGRCPTRERLTSATHAVGFYGAVPPTAAAARSVRVTQHIRNGVATLKIRSSARAVVQLDLICVPR